jgi:Flp pilus assembly protein TadG
MRPNFGAVLGFLSRFLGKETDGSLLPMFALSMVPMIGMVGAAVDYSRANGVRTTLQAALDSAVLAGARDGTSNWIDAALAVFNANLYAKGATPSAPVFAKNDDGSYSGSVTATVPASFLKSMGITSIPARAQSRAVLTGSTAGQFCILALSSNAQPAVKLTGNAAIDIKAPQCVLQVNSNSASAVYIPEREYLDRLRKKLFRGGCCQGR